VTDGQADGRTPRDGTGGACIASRRKNSTSKMLINFKLSRCWIIGIDLQQCSLLIVIYLINNNNNPKTMFMVLSSWQSHCESSPGSFDECRTAPSGRRPKTKPDDLG